MNEVLYRPEDWVGNRIWFLTIIGKEGANFICKCDCGTVREVKPVYLLRGKVKSCGREDCKYHHKMFYDDNAQRATIHGGARDGKRERLYRIWGGMKYRCYIPSCESYKYYGGRGITICDEWRYDFAEFRDWALSHGYSDDLSIDRIDVNGNYCPENCRWADAKTQRMNQRPCKRRNGKQITINGVTKNRKEWAKEFGTSEQLARYYEKRLNCSFEEALRIITDKKAQQSC